MNPRLRPDYLDCFITVARIVWGGDAPTWLAEQLWRWCREVCHVRDVDNLRPTRAKMKSTLLEVEEALSLVMEALESPWVREFLDGSSNGPIVDPDQLISGLVDLWDRAAEAQNFPALATKSGGTKPGPGKAKLEAISPHVVCAILISEAWKHVHGVEPRPKNRRLREAAEAYWKAIGGGGHYYGEEPLALWRHHFKKAASTPAKELRTEWRRHLVLSELDWKRRNSACEAA